MATTDSRGEDAIQRERALWQEHVHRAMAASPPNRWRLMVGDSLPGDFVYCGYETPWFAADFMPAADFSKFIPHFRWLDLPIDAPDADESPELLAMIEEVNNQGLNMIDIETGYTWRPTINFAPDFSWASFR